MGKIRRIAFYLMIPVALILIVEGILYFTTSGFSPLAVALCTLENALRAFVASPSINAFYAIRTVKDSSSIFAKIWAYVYVAVIIVAPILTTTAILSGFQAFILDLFQSLKFTRKKKLFIIGDGAMTKTTAQKYSEKYEVYYLMPGDTADVARIPFLKKDVCALAADYNNIIPSLKATQMEKADCIMINFTEWFKNYKTISNVIEYMVMNSGDTPIRVAIIDAPTLYLDVFRSLYKGLCIKYNREETVFSVSFTGVNETNVKKFFENPNLTVQPDGYHHIIFVGIGEYGRTLLRGLFSYMYKNNLWGTIEVFDRNIDSKVTDLIFSYDDLQYFANIHAAEKPEGAKLSVQDETKAGPIKINYYQSIVGELNFAECAEKILKNNTISEMFFCVRDISTNLECYRMMSLYAVEKENVRLYFRAGSDLADSFDALELYSDKYHRLPDGLPDIDLF